MAYPTAYDIKVKINSVDRTANVVKKRIVIEDVEGLDAEATIPIDSGAALGLVGLQDVVISNQAEDVRYFAGLITELNSDKIANAYLKFDPVKCTDYAWYLDHPEDLLTGQYTGRSDVWLIENVIAPVVPNLDCATHVVQVLATIDFIEFDGDTPRKALEKIKEKSGAVSWVDFGPGGGGTKANLYYEAEAATSAPFDLSDDPDGAATMAFQDLRKTDKVPNVNRVTVVGRNDQVDVFHATSLDTQQGTAIMNAGGAGHVLDDIAPPAAQDFNDWKTVAGDADYMVVVRWTYLGTQRQAWAYLGDVADADTINVYEDIALTTPGWNGFSVITKPVDSYNIYQAGGDYGYWLIHKIVDNDLITGADLLQRGDQFLASVADGVRYTCMCLEPGLRAGQSITLTDALYSVDTAFTLRQVTTQFTVDGYARHYLEMGARIPRFADVLAGGRNVWDEDKFLPKHPGLIKQEDAGTDVQATHYPVSYTHLTLPTKRIV